MGALDAYLIMSYATAVDDKNDGDMDKMTANEGLKGLLFGIMLGASGYLAGIALANRSDTILQMIGLNGYSTSSYKLYNTLSTVNTDQPGLLYLQEGV